MSQSDSAPSVPANPASRLTASLALEEGRDGLRVLGGLLIGLGLTMLFLRKSSSLLGDTWGDFALLLVLLVATVFLYGGALAGRRATGGPRPWEGIYAGFGVLLVPLTLEQFIQLVNGTPGASLNITWVFLVTAVLAAYAAMNGFRWQWLLATLAVIVAWSAFWNKILSNGLGDHFDVYRVLLLVLALGLLGIGWMIGAASDRGASDGERADPGPFAEFVTGASVAAVIAGSLSAAKLAVLGNPLISISGVNSAVGWEVVLLLVSLAAIAYAGRAAVRGPAYIGGLGLFFFLLIAGLDLNDSSPSGKLVGWPLILLVIGVVAFVASMRRTPG